MPTHTDAALDSRLRTLLDKQAIEEVVLRYCRGIDRRDFALVRSCYHDDARDHHGSFSGTADEYIEWVDGLTARYTMTMHYVANVFVEFAPSADPPDAPDLATCESYGVSLHRSDDPRPFMNMATGFRYLDRFERRADAWRIAERHAIGEWSMPIPEDAWWAIPDSHAQSARDARDPLYAMLAAIGRDRSRE